LNYTKNNKTHNFLPNKLYISLTYDTNRCAKLVMVTESHAVRKPQTPLFLRNHKYHTNYKNEKRNYGRLWRGIWSYLPYNTNRNVFLFGSHWSL